MSIALLLLENVGKMIPEMEIKALLVRLIKICTIELWVSHGETLFQFFCGEKHNTSGK